MKTFLGFDSTFSFTFNELHELRKTYRVSAYYLGGPEAYTETRQADVYARNLHSVGFFVVPIYVGYQHAFLAGKSDSEIRSLALHASAETLHLLRLSGVHHSGCLALDWESGLTREGSLYASTWATLITRAGYIPVLYRPRSGLATPGHMHTWLAWPETHVTLNDQVGIQHTQATHFGHAVDVTVWDVDFFERITAVTQPTAIHGQHDAHVTHLKYLHDLHVAHLAHLRRFSSVVTHPTTARAHRAATVVAASGAMDVASTSGKPSLMSNAITVGSAIAWFLLQEYVVSKRPINPAVPVLPPVPVLPDEPTSDVPV